MAYKCPECGTVYQEPTVCAGSPVVDGAISDYKKPVHEPQALGLRFNDETGGFEEGEAPEEETDETEEEEAAETEKEGAA